MVKIMVEREHGCYLFTLIDGGKEPSILAQVDYEFPSFASYFGWSPCCDMTDGSVDCKHKTTSAMIGEAIEILDEHCGVITEVDDSFMDYFQ